MTNTKWLMEANGPDFAQWTASRRSSLYVIERDARGLYHCTRDGADFGVFETLDAAKGRFEPIRKSA